MDIHIRFVSELLIGNFIFKWELICLHTSITIVSLQLNHFNYCYLALIILFNINHLFADNDVVISIAKTKLVIHLHTGKWSNSSIWPIYRTLSGAIIPGQRAMAMKGWVLHITGASPSDCLASYPEHSLEGVLPTSTEIQSVYSIVPAYWAQPV